MNDATANILSISGGKDSTAMALLAKEMGAANTTLVFADTGHEHQITYEYIDYLETILGPIQRVKADFTEQVLHKREVVTNKWRRDGIDESTISAALEVLKPTGIPFLDLCLWKGRFPSTRRRFCSEELKQKPITNQVIIPAMGKFDEVISWQGVRADESPSRAHLSAREIEFGNLSVYRPILKWSAEDVFDFHKKNGVKPNPLYLQGMSRVGCMPCIHARKGEMFEISKRFPEELARVREWERLVSIASKRGAPTFMDARVTAHHLGTGTAVEDISPETHGIDAYVSWAKTAHGGKQFDLLKAVEIDDIPLCSSLYGLCE